MIYYIVENFYIKLMQFIPLLRNIKSQNIHLSSKINVLIETIIASMRACQVASVVSDSLLPYGL